MNTKFSNPALRKLFQQWLNSKGAGIPSTTEGMKIAAAQFFGEMRVRMQQPDAIGAAGDNAYAADPLSQAEKKINILRTSGGLFDISEPETEDSDFGDLIRQRHAAMEEAGGDDLAAAAILKGQNKIAATAAAPSMSTNPPSAIGAIMGGQQIVSPASNPVELARWNGENNESTNITVTTGAAQYSPPGQNSSPQVLQINPFLIVQWGTNGFALRAEIDIGQGVQFTVGCSFMSLSVTADALQKGAAGNQVASSQNVTAMLSFRQIEKSTPVTRSIRDFNFASNTTYTVPSFAKYLLVTAGVIDNTTVFTVVFFNIGGSRVSAATFNGDSTARHALVPPDATTFNVTVAGTVGTFVQSIFTLGF